MVEITQNGELKLVENNYTMLLCPVCGFNFNHIGKTEVVRGLRNDFVRIKFYCESGHEWKFVLKFHKGVTYLTCEELKNSEDLV